MSAYEQTVNRATVRIRTSSNELRSLVSRPWNGGRSKPEASS